MTIRARFSGDVLLCHSLRSTWIDNHPNPPTPLINEGLVDFFGVRQTFTLSHAVTAASDDNGDVWFAGAHVDFTSRAVCLKLRILYGRFLCFVLNYCIKYTVSFY